MSKHRKKRTNKKRKGSKKHKHRKRKNLIKKRHSFLSNLIISMCLTIFIFIVFFFSFYRFDKMAGYSMMPTIQDNNITLAKRHTKLKRFDLVVIRAQSEIQVRRLIGMPTEKIQYENDRLYVNEQEIEEKFLIDQINGSQSLGMNYTENISPQEISSALQIPANKYFVLGDNRQYSYDSRNYGLIEHDQILGVVKSITFPIDHFELF